MFSLLIKYFIKTCTLLASVCLIIWMSHAANPVPPTAPFTLEVPNPNDTIEDSQNGETELRYPLKTETTPFTGPEPPNNLHLQDPKNFSTEVEYDPETNSYIFQNKIGENLRYGAPNQMSFEEYRKYDMDRGLRRYWNETASARRSETTGSRNPKIHIGGEVFDKIFGGSAIDIKPSGSAELIFGVIGSRRDDPALDVKQRRQVNFDFQEKIQMNVTAKIGDKIELGTNYNTEATFDFENKMNLGYEGKEDEIIKLIEAGDVSMPLSGTLITGSQSLFGIKTKLQFGKVTMTSIFSQQKSQTSSIQVSGGAQLNNFELNADQYEDNKHFFLSQYFRDNYEQSLANLPVINSKYSITKIEVWVTTIGAPVKENRNIVAFQDLGEDSTYYKPFDYIPGDAQSLEPPDNGVNKLYGIMNQPDIRNINTVKDFFNSLLFSQNIKLTSGIDYEKVENARKLDASDFTFNSKLGFISLNNSLNPDQVLAVAYEYKDVTNDETYQVGEFSNEGISAPSTLIVKLLKSTSANTQVPLWNLMMKNVYNIGAYQVNSEDFRLNILYRDDENGVPTAYLKEGAISGVAIIKVLGLDKINTQQDPYPDGVFDFIDNAAIYGGTIQAQKGRIYFPILEPFGKNLRRAIDPDNPYSDRASKYAYDSLYTMTKHLAQQITDKNKFIIEGTYKSAAGSEISLNAMNVPKGSVKVTAGGIPLKENEDFTVDYTLGRVKIINEGILNSGTPINISLENNSLFAIQTKTLMGTHFDYRASKNLNLGGTIMNLTERPLTQKINFGNEPISNTIWGVDGTFETESRLLTKLVDKLPFYDTKAPSNITVIGEFAHLVPGHSRAIGKSGTSYIDDFEGSKSSIDMKNVGTWFLASTPQGQSLFPEAAPGTGLEYGFNRANLNWYVVDPLFVRDNNLTPDYIRKDKNAQSNHFIREILETEVFPNRDPLNGQPINIAVLNLSFYPDERGPYNYDVWPTKYSFGVDVNGRLERADSRWGGIMRKVLTSDFEATNVEYIEFWMMDPFIYDTEHSGGQLYFNLGEISEDILRDSRKSYENGLPTSLTVENVDTTIWGRVPVLQALVTSFDNDTAARKFQDVGLDGLRNTDERGFFVSSYLDLLKNYHGESSQAYQLALQDPSTDDYHYFRGDDYDSQQLSVLDRYKRYNGMEGNSPVAEYYKLINQDKYPTQATTLPNVEDINRDNTLTEDERYFQYKIDLKPEKMMMGENYITDIYEAPVTLKNQQHTTVKWYQFKVPIRDPDKVVGDISDFKSIRFMRMFLKGFSEPIHCRFATLELVRGEWRRYAYSLLGDGAYEASDYEKTAFDISAVNIEENGKRSPVPYVLPPMIEREVNLGTTNLQKMNEQSLVLKVCDLIDGDARAVYKTTEFDARQYNKLEMYVHAEAVEGEGFLEDGDLTVFVRLGTDFVNNYYEYEMPVIKTPFGNYEPEENISDADRLLIWPEENNLAITFSDMTHAKMLRDSLLRTGDPSVSFSEPFEVRINGRTIRVVGVPSLSSIRTIMLGIRNPKKKSSSDDDDMQPKCAEVWLNELRFTDFREDGGWAALTRINANLADLGNVSLAANISTPGFGSIEKKVTERQKETITSYDMATNLSLGKFLPEKSGIKVPMHFDMSRSVSTPQYNPLNPDIIFREDLEQYDRRTEQFIIDSLKDQGQDVVTRRNLNFMNMRKSKTGKSTKTHLYDLSNFDFTYAYSEIQKHNIDIAHDLKKKYRGEIGYNFNASPKKVQPFAKSKILGKSKMLKLVRDFNFYYLPKTISIRSDLRREYNENTLRNKSKYAIPMDTTYIKNFFWNRIYNVKYDLAQSLKLDYSATAGARIDEPDGKIDRRDPLHSHKNEEIWRNVADLGRITNYDQKVDLNYAIPVNKIPLLDWVNSTYKYGGAYSWQAAPLAAINLGNTIESANDHQINGSFNMKNLYNKVGYLKKLNRPQRKPLPKPKEKNEDDTTKVKINYPKLVLDNTLKFLMGIQNASFTYSEGNGVLIPGFSKSPEFFGLTMRDNSFAPSAAFVVGLPDRFGLYENEIDRYANNNWLVADQNYNQPYAIKHTENFSYRMTVEPIKNLRVQITANSNYSHNYQAYYNAGLPGNPYTSSQETGSYSMSVFTFRTAFKRDNDDHESPLFRQFKDNRIVIAERLANQDENAYRGRQVNDTLTNTAYPLGYSSISQDVVIPAFLAAYMGKDASVIPLDPFLGKTNTSLLHKLPFPNWRISYNRLTDIPLVKKYFKSMDVSHSYRSTYSINSFISNTDYNEGDPFKIMRSALNDSLFSTQYEISEVSISEQFSPFISIDATMKNSLLAKFEIKKTRNLSFSLTNNQMTEVLRNEMILGLGYRFKDVVFNVRSGGTLQTVKSDLNVKADISIRTNKTILRKLVEDVEVPSSGQRVLSLNLSADYMINDRFTIRAFFDNIRTKPFVSAQFPNANTNAGVSLRFTLAQ